VAKKRMLLESTKIPADKSISQLQRMLTDAGAAAILIENDPAMRRPRALKFQLVTGGRTVAFALPARAGAIFGELQERRQSWFYRDKYREADQEQAERIAWRQVHRWVEAQLALTRLQMADLAEVFLPYAITLSGRTLYEEVQEHGLGGLLPVHQEPR
jgi:hypothetical protein